MWPLRPESLVKAFQVVSEEILAYEKKVYTVDIDGVDAIVMTPVEISLIETDYWPAGASPSTRCWSRVMQGVNR